MIRSPLKPTKPAATVKPKLHRCRICKEKFQRARSIQPTCEKFDCKVAYANQIAAKAQAKRVSDQRKDTAARKAAIKTISQLKAEAQKEFNAFIRERDRQAGHSCISSGRPLDWTGNGVDAGHYRSVGSADHLRFDERNCHAQSKQDNRYGSGNAVDYRIGLIKRIGRDEVDALESDQTIVKWTRELLLSIRALYRAKLRDLKKDQSPC